MVEGAGGGEEVLGGTEVAEGLAVVVAGWGAGELLASELEFASSAIEFERRLGVVSVQMFYLGTCKTVKVNS